jgi:hypothetical protein
MSAILLALAAGAGLARAGFGMAAAGTQGRSERDQIKRAYQITKRRTNEAQAYTRQGTNESLNARGILNGGANTSRSQVLKDAYAAGDQSAATNKKLGRELKAGKIGAAVRTAATPDRLYGTEEARMAADSETGQSGDASTLSGQVNTDLSREFYGEHQDLFSQRQAAINASKRGEQAARIGAIGSGIDAGVAVYNAGNMIKGAFGSRSATPAAPSVGEPGYQPPVIKPGSWFGGYDPVDPLGVNKKTTNDLFNVNER